VPLAEPTGNTDTSLPRRRSAPLPAAARAGPVTVMLLSAGAGPTAESAGSTSSMQPRRGPGPEPLAVRAGTTRVPNSTTWDSPLAGTSTAGSEDGGVFGTGQRRARRRSGTAAASTGSGARSPSGGRRARRRSGAGAQDVGASGGAGPAPGGSGTRRAAAALARALMRGECSGKGWRSRTEGANGTRWRASKVARSMATGLPVRRTRELSRWWCVQPVPLQ